MNQAGDEPEAPRNSRPRERRNVDFGAGVLDRADKGSAGHGLLGGISVQRALQKR